MPKPSTAAVNKVMLDLSDDGRVLWRNNIGAAIDHKGQWVKFGVGGKGGSDLIGIETVTIRPEHVGQTFGVFIAIEVKSGKGKLTKQQRNFLRVVNEAGGVALVARGDGKSPTKLENE